MPIKPFKLERYFAEYEFKVRYLLSASDCEGLTLAELLDMAAPESLALWQGLKLCYTESPGHPLLRAEVARLYGRVPPENVVVAAPEEAIFVAMHTLLRPGDHVIVETPAYQSLHEIARSIGCSVTPWTLEAGAEGWRLDLDRLEGSITDRTRLLVLNLPNNPTGYTLSRPELDRVIGLARAHGLYVFSDEMYRLLEYDAATRLPPVCDLYEKGISLSGLSKSFALPGLRVGWLATQENALIEPLLAFKDYTTICNSAPSEILGIIALQNRERIVERNLALIGGNLAIAEQFFRAYPGEFVWLKPQAGSIAFPRWVGGGPVEAFCRDVLDRQGVMIVPGSLFEYPGDHFRVGLGRKDFGEAIEQVEVYLRNRPAFCAGSAKAV